MKKNRGKSIHIFIDTWQKVSLALNEAPDSVTTKDGTSCRAILEALSEEMAAAGDYEPSRLKHAAILALSAHLAT